MSWTGDQMALAVGQVIAGAPGSVARSLITAIAHGQAPVDDLVRPAAGADPADLYDPAVAPTFMLPVLAAMSGIELAPDDFADIPALRARIIARPVRRRGSPDAIIAEVRALLTGSQTVRMTERADGNADLLRIETYAAESPDLDTVTAAARRRKAVGLLLEVLVIPGQTFANLRDSGQTFGQLRDSGQTFDDVRTTQI